MADVTSRTCGPAAPVRGRPGRVLPADDRNWVAQAPLNDAITRTKGDRPKANWRLNSRYIFEASLEFAFSSYVTLIVSGPDELRRECLAAGPTSVWPFFHVHLFARARLDACDLGEEVPRE